jgi:putative ABC transport system permease protein
VHHLCRWLLTLAGRIGGPEWRREGVREWEGELWALHARGAGPWRRVHFACDAVLHAVWLRWEEGKNMRDWGHDLRLAARRLGRTPGFTAITLAMLALGIGANTALFNALDAALRGSAPYPEADRLVILDLTMSGDGRLPPDTLPWSWPRFDFARERLSIVESVAAYSVRDLNLTRPGDAQRLGVEVVSPGYFELLGVRPAAGRVFTASEEPPAPADVAVLGHALWTTRFGGDPDVIGRSVTVEGQALVVVGVMPAGFRGLTGRGELWVPISTAATLLNPRLLEAASLHWFRAIGRLRRGTKADRAGPELAAVGTAMTEALSDPSDRGGLGIAAVPFRRARVNPVTRLTLGSVLAGGLLLLSIACANVASLLLARASARRADVAVRAALGAGRGRLVREQLFEGLLLSTGGGLLGLGLAFLVEGVAARAAGYALDTSGTRSLQFLDPGALGMNGSTLAVGLLLALATGLVSGLLPLRVAARPDLVRDLRGGPRGVLARLAPAGEAGRALLVTTQLALTLVLLAGAGLMGASFARLANVDVGFTRDDVLTLRFERRSHAADEEARVFERALLERVRSLPGVLAAAIAPCPPLVGPCEVAGLQQLDDGAPAGTGRVETVVTNAVTGDYFATLGVALRAGSLFETGLEADDPPVAMVNETAARALFGGSALGRRIALTHRLTADQPAQVVGVVADVRDGGLEAEPRPAVYFSRRQTTPWYGTLFVAVDGEPYALVDDVRREARALDPDLPLTEVSTLGDLRAAATARTRIVLGLLLAFAALGLLLSAVGVYGVVSYAVVRRTREMGLRLALGAPTIGLLRSVVARPALLASLGSLAGLAGALALTRRVQGLLYGVEPWDPGVLGGATVLLIGVATAAAWIPARRALRVDPVETLRGE